MGSTCSVGQVVCSGGLVAHKILWAALVFAPSMANLRAKGLQQPFAYSSYSLD